MMSKEGYKLVQIGPKDFNIPTNWEKTLISEVCENLDRKREPVKASNRETGDIPYYGATGCIDYVNDYIFDEKLVLVGEDGADWSKFAQTAYIIEGKSWVNNHAHVLRCISIEDKYLSELLNYLELNYIIVGTNRGKLNKKALMNLEILSPPLSEQKKIASIFSSVDKSIKKTDEVIEETKQLKKGLMQELLTKGIGNDEFKEVRIGPRVITVPKSWKIKRINDIANVKGGKRVPKGKTLVEEKTDYPYIRVADFNNYSVDTSNMKYATKEIFEKIQKYTISKEDVYISIAGTVGFVGVVPDELDGQLLTENAAKIVINNKSAINNKFLAYALSGFEPQSQIKGYIGTTGVPKLALKRVKKLTFPLPPIEEQKKISSILSSVDRKIQKEQEYKEQLVQLKKGLMQKLLTGKIRVKVDEED